MKKCLKGLKLGKNFLITYSLLDILHLKSSLFSLIHFLQKNSQH
jgi:hypothetical protein